MKVIVNFKDGTSRTIEISKALIFEMSGPSDAILAAKKMLRPEEREMVKTYEVEEDFL